MTNRKIKLRNYPSTRTANKLVREVIGCLNLKFTKDDGEYIIPLQDRSFIRIKFHSMCMWKENKRVNCGVKAIVVSLVAGNASSIFKTRSFAVRKDDSFNLDGIATAISNAKASYNTHIDEVKQRMYEKKRVYLMLEKERNKFMKKYKKYKPKLRWNSCVGFELLNIEVSFAYDSELDAITANIDTDALTIGQLEVVFEFNKQFARAEEEGD